MDQATLVVPDLQAGRQALAALDAAGMKQIIALFALLPEYGDWRLILSSTSLDQNHLLKAHDKVARILGGKFVYTLPIFMILPTRDAFIRDLRKYLNHFKPGSGYMRLGGQTFGKWFVAEAIVIRLPGIID